MAVTPGVTTMPSLNATAQLTTLLTVKTRFRHAETIALPHTCCLAGSNPKTAAQDNKSHAFRDLKYDMID